AGLFSGFDPETGTYDETSWQYRSAGDTAAGAGGTPEDAATGERHGSHGVMHASRTRETDPTLTNPRCVFRLLARHFERYTPEMVEEVCGVPRDLFEKVAEALCDASGPDRTGA